MAYESAQKKEGAEEKREHVEMAKGGREGDPAGGIPRRGSMPRRFFIFLSGTRTARHPGGSGSTKSSRFICSWA